MALKLSELFAKVLRLESHLAEEAKQELSDFKAAITAQVNQLQSDLVTAQASVTDLTAKLAASTTDLSAATGSLTEIKSSITAAVAALKLDLKADASPVEAVNAMQSAVSSTLAKLSVQPGAIPAAKPGDNGQAGNMKTMSFKDFSALAPAQKMAFMKEVNLRAAKLVD